MHATICPNCYHTTALDLTPGAEGYTETYETCEPCERKREEALA